MQYEGITGHLILIMAPSGSGKGALIQHLRDTFQDRICFAVSDTSRPMRPGEENGKVYHFKTREEFEDNIKADSYLEWQNYGGNLYGIPKKEVLDPLREGKVVVREIELQGIKALTERLPKECRTIVFIDGGPWELLEQRIRSRAPITEEELELRRQRYLEESASKSYADVIIENIDGKVDIAKEKLEALVRDHIV